MSPSQEDGNDVLLVVRQLTSRVRRHHKAVFLFRLWRQAMDEGNAVISAALFSFLATELPVEAARRAPYNFNALSNDQCVERFRFTKVQVVELVTLFGLEGIRTRERTAATGAEGLCILLYKLAVPVRWVDLKEAFGRDSSGLSNIFLHMLTLLDDKYAKLLYFNDSYVVQNLQAYADAVFDAGGLLQNVWAFIDGTVRGICRPRPRHTKRDGKFMSQKSVYNGHKRKHALKYQTLTTPDGLIAHLYGPFPGRNHDSKLFKDSKISERIRNDSRFQQYMIYGDQAYGNDDVLTSPYAGEVENLSREQRQEYESCTCFSGVVIRTGDQLLDSSRFQTTSSSWDSTSWTYVSCWCLLDKLYYLYTGWQHYQRLLRASSSKPKRLFEH
ncbi:hypothetical protein PPTG_11143 [Phytophthora nicotianae INRA-310]|uniref:DDE Tnp4 domain-containing protein n=1 Tax=Phytophthora nicotianae (strain INRA-310) TaxID=761204 RepID=W2Q7G0_PHYN3|nr:hypothetical protein PPTG_11143 [Phytophthora nicotianae INRA-310]ETN09097.1 hypothetical protein PPTG_11143 [Phytophthora nicotianae INRA-310]